jgi:hypothetical protein
LNYALSLAQAYYIVLVVDYKSLHFEEMQYRDELKGRVVRKYELLDHSLKEVH